MTLDFITERDSELRRYRSGCGAMRLIGKAGEVGYGSTKARIDSAGIDRGKMLVPCTVTTEDEDNSLDIIVTAGVDTVIHEANPVVKFDHGMMFGLPIGKAMVDAAYSVVRGTGIIKSVTAFSQSILEAEQVFQLCEEGILNGVSIGAIPIPDKIEKRAVINWKGLAGQKVHACRMFEYSHTPSPDNPQALTDRVLGGRLLAGKSMSPALYKSFEPYLVERPTQITVPALAAEVVKQLKAEGAVVIKKDGGYEDVTQKKPGEADPNAGKTDPPPPEKKDAGTDVNIQGGMDDAAKDDPTKDYPAGAKLLAGDYDRLMERCDFHASMAKGQENPAVKEYLTTKAERLAEEADEIKAMWDEHYKDVGELGGKKDEDEGGEDDAKPADKPAEKSLKTRLLVLPYRKSILASVPKAGDRDAELEAAKATAAKLTADNAKLMDALKKSLDREEKTRNEFRKAKQGR